MQSGLLQVMPAEGIMLWVVSGACRGVGKTQLGVALARLLPGGVYAKIGHNPPRDGKPANYFTRVEAFQDFLARLPRTCRHCVVESNLLARRGDGDLRIFIDAPDGARDLRDDAEWLAGAADIRVGPGTSEDAWREVLLARLEDPAFVAAICALLSKQACFIGRPRPAVANTPGEYA